MYHSLGARAFMALAAEIGLPGWRLEILLYALGAPKGMLHESLPVFQSYLQVLPINSSVRKFPFECPRSSLCSHCRAIVVGCRRTACMSPLRDSQVVIMLGRVSKTTARPVLCSRAQIVTFVSGLLPSKREDGFVSVGSL